MAKLMAHVWNDPGPSKPNKPRKSLIATCGTTLVVDPARRLRWRKDPETGEDVAYTKDIPRTDTVKTYFSFAGAIDRFNRVRQDGVRLERNFEVKEWSKRMIISLLGFVVSNAFKGAKLEGKYTCLNTFIEDLAMQLLTNEMTGSHYPKAKKDCETRKLQGKDFVSRSVPEPAAPKNQPVGMQDVVLKHYVRKLSDLTAYSGQRNPRATCSICRKNQATMFCIPCTQKMGGRAVVVCSSNSNPDCIPTHCQICG